MMPDDATVSAKRTVQTDIVVAVLGERLDNLRDDIKESRKATDSVTEKLDAFILRFERMVDLVNSHLTYSSQSEADIRQTITRHIDHTASITEGLSSRVGALERSVEDHGKQIEAILKTVGNKVSTLWFAQTWRIIMNVGALIGYIVGAYAIMKSIHWLP